MHDVCHYPILLRGIEDRNYLDREGTPGAFAVEMRYYYSEPWSRLLSVSTHLKNCEVLEDAVLHVSFRQMFEFQDKVDHVFTHRGSV